MESNDNLLIEMQHELGSVLDVIKFTKENIDALNQRFCRVKPGKKISISKFFFHSLLPPSFLAPKIYLEEYEDLTSKLHHFETMERDLNLKIEAFQAEVSYLTVH